ncbi:NucA/NucB deoxyribonuclease domain-containing protein [Paenibacillus polymyxa]|uniref:NucA/NucB deoxyribonuclease domain-containing protein n=1 Tax=Paenibacillus polymyxa TaxID=1406 RepID=UPI002AB35CC2|nr:NucA/NucB deoxyribonuclease domain-containing protein [Paenibacillus polymyxa]MDY8094187.1 NucA/NucB deoxyribonuclease domain-containing protein [Paenibacillus polymyxa]
MIKVIAKGLIVFLLAAIFSVQGVYAEPAIISQQAAGHTLEFPSSRHPETGAHIRDAIAAGYSAVCTIDRDGAEENRKESLKGYPTKKGYDRDEWPMAMCAEGGAGADIRYITPSDNRGAGSWVSHQLDKYADETKVRFIVK